MAAITRHVSTTGAAAAFEGPALRIAIVRVRNGNVQIVAETTIEDVNSRPASAWGAEAAAFLSRHGRAKHPLTVVVRDEDAIVRTVRLRGVAESDRAAALQYETDALHPYGAGAVLNAWSSVSSDTVLTAFAMEETIEKYAAIFAEAGLPVGTLTVPAEVLRSLRRLTQASGPLLAVRHNGERTVIYGESEAAPLFWAVTELPAERAIESARAQMRIDSSVASSELAQLLPEGSLAAGAAAASTSSAGPILNLLPEARRAARRAGRYIPTAVLTSVLALGAIALSGVDRFAENRTVQALEAESARALPVAQKSASTERERAATKRKIDELKAFRDRTRADLDAVREVTRLIAPPAWAQQFDLTRTTASVSGESEQAAEMLKVFDSSPMFRNSEFTSPLSRATGGRGDAFRIRAERRAGTAVSAPAAEVKR